MTDSEFQELWKAIERLNEKLDRLEELINRHIYGESADDE